MKLDSKDVKIPSSSVGVYDAIYRRRSVKQFTDDPVSGTTLEKLFSAAIWAPNHRLTEPTRFYAVRHGSPLRKKIARIVWRSTYETVASPNPEKKRHSADTKRDRVLNAPAMIYVYSLNGETRQMTLENYATSCCAVQNMALAAVAEGISLDWSTGGLTRIPGLADMLGAKECWTMVGVLFLGKAAAVPHTRRTPHSEVVKWL